MSEFVNYNKRSVALPPFARLVPVASNKIRRFKMPDIMARLKQDFGDSTYKANDLALGLRNSRGHLG